MLQQGFSVLRQGHACGLNGKCTATAQPLGPVGGGSDWHEWVPQLAFNIEPSPLYVPDTQPVMRNTAPIRILHLTELLRLLNDNTIQGVPILEMTNTKFGGCWPISAKLTL